MRELDRGQQSRKLGLKKTAVIATIGALGGAGVFSSVVARPERQVTPEPASFHAGYSIGRDVVNGELLVIDDGNNVVGPLGDGEFENGVQVTPLLHLRGGKIQDVAVGWIAEDSSGRFLDSGSIKAVLPEELRK